MTRRLLILNGIAVLFIPFHHATAFGLQALFQWTNQYRNVSVPNYDQLGSFQYDVLMFIRQIDAFAIPVFFFVSGFFIAFMARGRNLTLKTILPRVKVFLGPLLIWTIIRFAMLRRLPLSISEALDTYYFLVLLIQYYFLALIIVPAARKNWKMTLVVTFAMQWLSELPWYLDVLGYSLPGQAFIQSITPRWVFSTRIFYFTIGTVVGLNATLFGAWMRRYRWALLVTTVAAGILAFVEYEWLDSIDPTTWLGPNNLGFARFVYATTFPLAFLAFDKVKIPQKKTLEMLGTRSLGLYLANLPPIYLLAVFMYHYTPQALGTMAIYIPLLVAVGYAVPLLLMELLRRSPARRHYKLIFG